MIGYCEIHLHLPEVSSLKGKRKIIKSLIDRIKHRFNVSVSELDAHDKWQRSVIGIAYINRDRPTIDRVLNNVIKTVNSIPNLLLTQYFIDFL